MSQPAINVNPSQSGRVDLDNVQGDVIYGLAKDHEHFVLFTIVDPSSFKKCLPLLEITTSKQAKETWETIARLKAESPGQRHNLKLLNISFSQKGLHALGLMDDLGDKAFSRGQFIDASALGDTMDDKNQPKWKPEYFERIDGVLLGAGNTFDLANSAVNDALEILKGTVKEIYRLQGKTRPGDQRKHEHFGWRDGISNPVIQNLPYPPTHIYEDPVRAGVILVGHEGDDHPNGKPVLRPEWTFEGSFMAFRQLKQLVPEFHHFLKENPDRPTEIPRDEGASLQGARFFGRWKNGVPIQLSPTSPIPEHGDPDNLNKFEYPQEKGDAGQAFCPYSAHIRKTRPRNDISAPAQEATRINRKGIAYGEEVQPDEEKEHKTRLDRGLAFVCYQSNISENGFRFIQIHWANNPSFSDKKDIKNIGYDPIIGQTNKGERTTMGTQAGHSIKLPEEFVVTQGGEYFFTPSIKALNSVLLGKPYPK